MTIDMGIKWVCKPTTIDGYEKCLFLWVLYPFSKIKPINETTMLGMKIFLHSQTKRAFSIKTSKIARVMLRCDRFIAMFIFSKITLKLFYECFFILV